MQSYYSSQSVGLSLEAEFEQVAVRRRGIGRVKRWIKAGVTELLCFLAGQQTLSIRSTVLTNGTIQWRVYDPATDSRYTFDSQQAVRTWLEQRYYR